MQAELVLSFGLSRDKSALSFDYHVMRQHYLLTPIYSAISFALMLHDSYTPYKRRHWLSVVNTPKQFSTFLLLILESGDRVKALFQVRRNIQRGTFEYSNSFISSTNQISDNLPSL